MQEAFTQALDNLRANKLRSFLTMFGILWGIIAVVVLAATGEGFQRGNQAVLEELGKNIAIVWGGRTTMQAGGERAGRRVFLTVEDARAIEREAPLVAVVSAEINRGLRIKSRFNAASLSVHGIEPQYQAIRTIDIEHGRSFAPRTTSRCGASPSSAPTPGRSCSATRDGLARDGGAQRRAVHGHRQDPEEEPGQQLQRPRQRQGVRAVHRDGARLPAHRRARRHGLAADRVAPAVRRRAICRASSTRAPAASRTSTGRSSATSARCWRGARASTPRIATRCRCGTPRSRA